MNILPDAAKVKHINDFSIIHYNYRRQSCDDDSEGKIEEKVNKKILVLTYL